MWAAWKSGDRKAALAAIPDEVVDDLVVHVSYDEYRAHLQRYVDQGITVPVIGLVPFGIELYDAIDGLPVDDHEKSRSAIRSAPVVVVTRLHHHRSPGAMSTTLAPTSPKALGGDDRVSGNNREGSTASRRDHQPPLRAVALPDVRILMRADAQWRSLRRGPMGPLGAFCSRRSGTLAPSIDDAAARE